MAKAKSALTCGCLGGAFRDEFTASTSCRILWILEDGPLRYGEIRTGCGGGSTHLGIAPRVLAAN